jgi:hypothetical protein
LIGALIPTEKTIAPWTQGDVKESAKMAENLKRAAHMT